MPSVARPRRTAIGREPSRRPRRCGLDRSGRARPRRTHRPCREPFSRSAASRSSVADEVRRGCAQARIGTPRARRDEADAGARDPALQPRPGPAPVGCRPSRATCSDDARARRLRTSAARRPVGLQPVAHRGRADVVAPASPASDRAAAPPVSDGTTTAQTEPAPLDPRHRRADRGRTRGSSSRRLRNSGAASRVTPGRRVPARRCANRRWPACNAARRPSAEARRGSVGDRRTALRDTPRPGT